MTIDEAIKSLELENKHPWNRDNSDLRNAVKLGIEALKRVKEQHHSKERDYYALLPRETEE